MLVVHPGPPSGPPPASAPYVRCARGKANFSVGGDEIATVAYRADGHLFARVRSGRTVRLDLSRFPVGRHRITARVGLRDGDSRLVVVLRFTRCQLG
jgi:hypothetical protein